MLARKAHISGEEARLQGEKALEIEGQLERCKFEMSRVSLRRRAAPVNESFGLLQNEEQKRHYARQISECEQVIASLVTDSVKQ